MTVRTDASKELTDRYFLWMSEMINFLQADIADQKPCVTATEVQISRLLRRSVRCLDEIDKRGGELHREFSERHGILRNEMNAGFNSVQEAVAALRP